LVKKEDLELFKKELSKVGDNDYFEKALENLTLAKKIVLKPINIKENFVKEIDFKEDLEEVRTYLKNKE
jgi:choline kinase